MAKNEKAAAAIEEAEKIGIHVSYVSGFTVLTKSPRSEPRSDDGAAMEQDVIEQLGRNMREVLSLTAARARGARGKDLLGKECFVPSHQIVGTLSGCDANGTVGVAYPGFNPERDSKLNYSGPGDELLIIVDGDQQPEASSSALAPWIASEKLRVQIGDAENLGLRLEYDHAFLVVKWPAREEVERGIVVAAIRRLGRSLREVRAHMVARARGIGGGDFVGQRVLLPDLQAIGILERVGNDGSLEVTYFDKGMERERTCHFSGDALMIIVGEEAAQVSSADQKAEASWRKLLRRAFRG